jgi:hypothetical protein
MVDGRDKPQFDDHIRKPMTDAELKAELERLRKENWLLRPRGVVKDLARWRRSGWR